MSEIILDLGSGTNVPHMKKMIDAIEAIDTGKHDIVFKTQLFNDIPPNLPLTHDQFDDVYMYARAKGYECTSSIFDDASLEFLLEYEIPFVKIACREHLYKYIDEVPASTMVYVSVYDKWIPKADVRLICVPHYPADMADYRRLIMHKTASGISDHTVGVELFHEFVPDIWEKHLRLPECTGPDAGEWAALPEDLKEIL